MIKLEEKNYSQVEKYLEDLFFTRYYTPLLEIIGEESKILNNSKNALLNALETGKVVYNNGIFSGTYNSGISNELAKFAKFDGRSKTWKADNLAKVPNYVKVAANEAESRLVKRTDEMNRFLDKLEANKEEAEYFETPIKDTIDDFQEQLQKDMQPTNLTIDITSEQKKNMEISYNNNMSFNIKNWEKDQIVRLRDMVTNIYEDTLDGKALKDRIKDEWNVSENKAKFLARQETSLFLSEFRKEQSLRAGVREYIWMATGGKSGDGRTTDLHKKLHGKRFFYGQPPIADEYGNRHEPGERFGCRCTAKPVLE